MQRSKLRRALVLGFVGCCAFLLFAHSSSEARPQAQAPAQQLTVERIYGAPSLGGEIIRDTEWSPDGKSLAYLGRDADNGEQEIIAVDAASGRKRVLVEGQQLRQVLLPPASRGQQTGLGRITPPQFLWAPNSQALLFISAEQLFWYDLQTKTSHKLLATSVGAPENAADEIDDAKISPDGKSVSFLRGHDVWIVNVATSRQQQITHGGTTDVRNGELDWVYPEELDLHTGYWWSPDSAHIAFLQLDERPVGKYPLLSAEGEVTEQRYPVAGSPNPIARVGVATISASGANVDPKWMDTGADNTVLLARVTWLRDSSRVSIQRFNRLQNHLDLLFADAASGKSQTILTEQDSSWINVTDDLYFLADGKHFLWTSERPDIREPYLYDLTGKQMLKLTRGGLTVDHIVGVDDTSGQVYFTGTTKNAIERQLYRFTLSERALVSPPFPETLTHSPGTHEIDLAPGAGHFVDTYSRALQPPSQTLYKSDGATVSVLAANKVEELDSYHLSPVQFLRVPGADGVQLDAEVIEPPNFDTSKKYPVLVDVYGGPGVQNVVDAWKGSTFLWDEMMAQQGFIVFSVDNHGASGHGHKFESAIFHHFGQADLADQVAAVTWLSRQPVVDTARIGIWGWSFGGTMTCLAMLRDGDIFKAGFAGAPVTDWRLYDTIYTERYMGTPQEDASGYHDASAINYATGLRGKLLIAQATGDDNVHFANTVELSEKLIEAGKYAEVQIYPGRGHGISDAAARVHIFNRMTQFFVENLAK
jgi:dipeptidyl-peptidase 4